MKILEDKIRNFGQVLDGDILKVDSFINHQIDISLSAKLADEFYKLYNDCGINKILTIESSGISIASLVAERFSCPLVFAKKTKSSNVGNDFFSAPVFSYTHNNLNNVLVSKKYLSDVDKVLIIDDFLATGEALLGLINICNQANADVIGCGVLIEKEYQSGGDKVRSICRVESLARIKSMSKNEIEFI